MNSLTEPSVTPAPGTFVPGSPGSRQWRNLASFAQTVQARARSPAAHGHRRQRVHTPRRATVRGLPPGQSSNPRGEVSGRAPSTPRGLIILRGLPSGRCEELPTELSGCRAFGAGTRPDLQLSLPEASAPGRWAQGVASVGALVWGHTP